MLLILLLIGGAFLFFFGYFNVYVWMLMYLHIPTEEGIKQLREMNAQVAVNENSNQQQTSILGGPIDARDVQIEARELPNTPQQLN